MFIPLSYIDPGTGSMIFSLFIGIAAAASFGINALWMKLKFIFSGGKSDKSDKKNIPFVIFSDHKRYWNVFHSLCDEFENHKTDLTYYTASSDDPVLSQDYKYIHAEYLGDKNKPYARMNMLHADIVVATTPGLDVYQWKRSPYVKYYVHIPHGLRPVYAYRMFGVDYYDAVLASGENQVESGQELEMLRPTIARKEFVIVGSAAQDNIMQQKEEYDKRKIDAPKTKKVVLVAPSWGKSGMLTKYGKEFLSAISQIQNNYDIIIRPHPQTVTSEQDILKPLMEEFKNLEWNFDNDNFSVLSHTDILISDFSGMMYDFALCFNKPVIYTNVELNRDPYDMYWHKGEIWEFRVLPKIGTKLNRSDFEHIGNIIQTTLDNEEFQKGRDEVRAECWEYPGESSRREYEYLINKYKELTDK